MTDHSKPENALRDSLNTIIDLRAQVEKLQANPSERYWEGRWRDEKERMWCSACGTVTRDLRCDCNRYPEGHEMRREPHFVNYADELQRNMQEMAEENNRLRAALSASPQQEVIMEQGRDEVCDAIDVILKSWSHRNARLTLALEQLDKAAAEIERLKTILLKSESEMDCEGQHADCTICEDIRNAHAGLAVLTATQMRSMKLIYAGRWRTFFAVPAVIADEVRAALSASPQQEGEK